MEVLAQQIREEIVASIGKNDETLHALFMDLSKSYAYLWNHIDDVVKIRNTLLSTIKLFLVAHPNLQNVTEAERETLRRDFFELITSPHALLAKTDRLQIKRIEGMGVKQWVEKFIRESQEVRTAILTAVHEDGILPHTQRRIPPTSIIVPFYNKHETVLRTIQSLFFPSLRDNAPTFREDAELIFVDDCSPLRDETREMISRWSVAFEKRYRSVRLIENPTNQGFGKSVNIGVRAATFENILILNDDIYLPQGAIESLILALNANPRAAVVGPVSNQKDMFTYQVCRQAPKLTAYTPAELGKLEVFGLALKNAYGNQTIKTDLITGFCFATRKSLFLSYNGFDEGYINGYYEDTDFFLRAGKTHDILIAPGVYVHHGGIYGHSISMRQIPIKAARYGIQNMALFARRWGWRTLLRHNGGGYLRMTGRNTFTQDYKKKLLTSLPYEKGIV